MVQEYLKAILDNSPESIILIGKNHEALAFNKTIKEVLFQYFNKEIKEGDIYYPDFVIEDTRNIYLEAYNKAIQGETTTVQLQTQNENISYWFEYRMNPIYDEKGGFLGVSLSARNITAEKEAELKIIDISEKLKAVLDNTDESIVLLDLEFKILTMNKTAIAQYNTTAERIAGNDFRKFIAEDNDNPFYKHYPDALKGHSSSVEIFQRNSKNKLLCYHTKYNPVYDKSKKLIGVSIFATDITEKRKLELSLQESEDRFRKISTLAPVGIIITNKEFQITYSNVAIRKMLEYETERFYNLRITDIVNNFTLSSKKKIRVDHLNIDIETPIFNQEKFEAITKTNCIIDILLSSSTFYSQDELSYIFIIQNITDIKQKEDLIAEQNSKLRDIAWYQSHIIRAPLARIMGLISLVEESKVKVDNTERVLVYKAILDSSHELDKAISEIVGKTY